MSNKKQFDNDRDGSAGKKRSWPFDKKKEILIDLSNSQEITENKHDDSNPTERQLFFLSQFYNASGVKNRTPKRHFPGPAGFLNKNDRDKITVVKPVRGLKSKLKSLSSEKYQETKQINALSDVNLPETNITWVEMKKYFRLSNRNENDLLNMMNIKIIEEKMKGWNSSHPRISVPFLAVIITDDGGLGSISDVSGHKSCISIKLEDITGSITALFDGHALFRLSHLLLRGTSLILAKPEVHKVYGKLHLSLSLETVICLAVNNKDGKIQVWKDIPIGFGSRNLGNDVILFDQTDLNKQMINLEISKFKEIIFRRPSSSPAKIIPSWSVNDSKSDAVAHCSKSLINVHNNNTENVQDYDEFDDNNVNVTDIIEFAESCEKDYKLKTKDSVIYSKIRDQQTESQKKIQPHGELEQDINDDCNLNTSLIEFMDQCAENIKKNTEFSVDKEKNLVQHEDSKSPSFICGEFQDDNDDGDFDSSLIEIAMKYDNTTEKEKANYSSNGQDSSNKKAEALSNCQVSLKEKAESLSNDKIITNEKVDSSSDDLKIKDEKTTFGEFDDSNDAEELELSLVEVLEKVEKETVSKHEPKQNVDKLIVGEFEDESDDEYDSFLVNLSQ